MLALSLRQVMYFFFNDTATTEIYTLSLHDALPILTRATSCAASVVRSAARTMFSLAARLFSVAISRVDRKSTRLNSSHANISYAVFCLKKRQAGNARRLTHRFAAGDMHTQIVAQLL